MYFFARDGTTREFLDRAGCFVCVGGRLRGKSVSIPKVVQGLFLSVNQRFVNETFHCQVIGGYHREYDRQRSFVGNLYSYLQLSLRISSFVFETIANLIVGVYRVRH